MKITIGDHEIKLAKNDVVVARAIVNLFLDKISTARSKSLYYTTLLMMYLKSSKLLNELGLENLGFVTGLVEEMEDEAPKGEAPKDEAE